MPQMMEALVFRAVPPALSGAAASRHVVDTNDGTATDGVRGRVLLAAVANNCGESAALWLPAESVAPGP